MWLKLDLSGQREEGGGVECKLQKKNSFLLAAQPHYFEVWAVLVILPELFVSGL